MCVLYAQLMKHQTAVNQNGLAYIEARVDEDAVRGCPVCGGLRHLEEHDAQGYRRVRPCAGTNALRRIELFNAARVPARYKDSSFDNFITRALDDPKALDTYIKKIREFHKGVTGNILEGNSGTGKTHMLCAGIRYLTLELGIPCRYVDFSALSSEARASYASNSGYGPNPMESEWELLKPLLSIPVLFLDELGKGQGLDNRLEQRLIDEIVNRRYDNPDLTTFFASNFLSRETSGYMFYMQNGYAKSLSGDLKDAQDWMKFATERFYKENETRGSRTEPPFKDVNEFLAEVARIMKQSHLEDRVTERTASRIRSMAVPLVIRAPDHRLLPDNMKSG